MTPTGIIVQQSVLNTPTFLAACVELLGYSPARAADSQNLKDTAHDLSCLSSFRARDANPGVKYAKEIYELITIGVLVVADERDMPEILEVAGLPFALTETKVRGIQAALVSGTFANWRTVVPRGCSSDVPMPVRICYDTFYLQFRSIGLEAIFEKSQRTLDDNTFLLE